MCRQSHCSALDYQHLLVHLMGPVQVERLLILGGEFPGCLHHSAKARAAGKGCLLACKSGNIFRAACESLELVPQGRVGAA